MALKPCRECGREVSIGADSCPHCGAKPKSIRWGWIAVLGFLGFCAYSASSYEPAVNASSVSTTGTPAPSVQLELDVVSCVREYSYLTTHGIVRNVGDATVRFVQADTRWYDSAGEIVETGFTYAVGSEFLRPGEDATFQAMTRHPSAQRCGAVLRDYDIVPGVRGGGQPSGGGSPASTPVPTSAPRTTAPSSSSSPPEYPTSNYQVGGMTTAQRSCETKLAPDPAAWREFRCDREGNRVPR